MRKLTAGVLVGFVAAALVLTADRLWTLFAGGLGLTPLDTVELKTYDWRLSRTARPEKARKDIALVEIDERSLRNLQPNAGRWPWPRVVHAELIDYLTRGHAKVIAYDVDFAEPDTRTGFKYGESVISGTESDRDLAASIAHAGNVILLADATYEAQEGVSAPMADSGLHLDSSGVTERRVVFPPFRAISDVAAGLGHNLFVLDADGPLRHGVPFVRSGRLVLPSLGVVAALRAGGIAAADVRANDGFVDIGTRKMPQEWRRVSSSSGTTDYQWALINFRGPAFLPGSTSRPYASYSFWDLLYSEEQIRARVTPDIDPSVFRDKTVFVGVTAAGLFDVFETPFSGGKMPGIQVQAAVADDILSNRFMRPASRTTTAAGVIAGGLAVGLLATIVPPWWAGAATLATMSLFIALAMRVFAAGYWLNVTQPALAGALALFGGVAYQYLVEGREKRKMKKLFGQYVSKDVYDQLVENPALARLGGQRREMTVLFSDIRGFTTVSERGQPEEIVALLNEYFTRMVDIVFRHKGTLDKFVGDMVMALFGAPLDDPDHADHAVEAALEMVEALQQLNAGWKAHGRPELDIGIGINTGPMIAGNIGSEAIMSYTVIGDAVNLGSRLESLNKQYGTRIIISDATRARVTRPYRFRPLGDVVVKGKSRPVAIFEVVGRAERAAEVQRA